ncbi:MAG: GLPGLI family protein [Flavobacteriia bacterium]|nr:GLPGLI family protein [Flavobacteriia bacterium]OIP48052.1 MAG: GLPGLI family protein [Flavobacteriaceae bacterium CG2_30_31_66]PIV95971.1 MAG: GLPGLI family protein [Flavobacteriaceae bacterium CG17_big_fil_post_rev_8_21_14_2_50_31_13]PIX11526.1 MAG: GLPGLI family protein [Flavobacteriaceae bacterium CG_4_8_14_3_um_filter_31_8]PIY14150.1 MAG: GLPGLI family protein [Flavobacteriaceae bacterium CG_4_10_14_3_um_filter_31_253]PIZ11924.1 MAG: GLPGLI family protein [Flavobacteriaceae bacterium C
MKYIFFFLFPFITFSQEKVILISYKAVYNTELPTTKNGFLYVSNNQKKTIYFTEKISKNKDDEDQEVDVTVRLNSGENQYNYFDYEKDTLFTKDDIFRESKIIKEKIPRLKWTLLEESKTIEDVTLNKATCYFRGRNYIAWYSTSTAIKSGPWKFQGLPGLIYQIYDETKRYNWFLQYVKVANYDFNSENLNFKNKETISIKEYANLKFNNNDELDSKILTKLPRGATIVNQKTFRTGFEIKFEWEEDLKED